MTSSRLPGKVLADLGGRPMLAQQLRRLALATSLDEIVVATTDRATDDPVCALAEELGFDSFRGSENDVLERFAGASKRHGADIVVRVTADCPLIDPQVVDRVVGELLADESCDYASNVIERSYPQGLDVEALRADVLERVAATAVSKQAREHVTWHIIREAPESFRLRSVTAFDDHSTLRWTVDTAVDLELVRRIYSEVSLTELPSGYRHILAHVLANPELQTFNKQIV